MGWRENRSSEYARKLKNPLWQKRRLQILERDKWACAACGDEKSTLHVHHWTYGKDQEPWEADDSQLSSLCEHCHELETFHRLAAEESVLSALRESRWPVSALMHLAGTINFETDGCDRCLTDSILGAIFDIGKSVRPDGQSPSFTLVMSRSTVQAKAEQGTDA